MAQKIEIFKLDIDLDAAISSATEMKKEADSLKKQLDLLKKSGDTTSRTYVELEGKYKAVRKEYNASQREIGKMIKLQGKEIKTVEAGRNALTLINKEWARQASLFGVNSKEADVLAKKHKELKDRVNELQKGIGDTSGNIGNYSSDIQEAIGKTTLFGRAQGIVTDIMNIARPVYAAVRTEVNSIGKEYRTAMAATSGYSKAQKAAAIGTNITSAALKLLKVALIATGIGAIVVLLGSLVAWFSKTQTGIDLVNKVLAGLGAAFDVIVDRLSQVGGALIKLVTGDFSGAFNDIKDAASGFGDELEREIKLAIRLEEVLQNVEKAEINLSIRRSAANARLKELNKTIEDRTQSEKDRLKAAQEYAKIEEGLVAEEVANQEKKVAAMLGYDKVTNEVRETIKKIGQEGVSLDQLGLSESTVEDMKEFRDEVTKLYDLQNTSLEKQTTNQNKYNTILDEVRRKEEANAKAAQKRREEAIDAAIKENEIKLKLFIEETEGHAKSLEAQLDREKKIRDEKLSILQQEVDAGNKTQTEAELEKLKIKKEFLAIQKEIVLSFAQEELEIFKSNHQSKLQANQLLTDAMVDQEKERLDAIAAKEREYQTKRLKEGELSQIAYNEKINEINKQYQSEKDELEAERKAQQKEKEAIDFENAQELRIERDNRIYEAKLLDLQRLREAEIESAEKVGANTALIDKKYAVLREHIKQEETNAKLQAQQNLFGGIAELLGKETAAGKAAGIAQATMNTYQGVTQVWRAPSILPEPLATINKVIQTGIVLGSGLSAVKKISSTDVNIPKAEKGALFKIGGKPHSAGGTKFQGEDGTRFEAEKDELIGVMNKNAAAHFMRFNNLYAKGGYRPNYFASGGIVSRGSQTVKVNTQQIDYQMMASLLQESLQQLPRPVVAVEDINTGQKRYTDVIDGANL